MLSRIAAVLMWVGLGLAFLCSVLTMFFDVAAWGALVGAVVFVVGLELAFITGGAKNRS